LKDPGDSDRTWKNSVEPGVGMENWNPPVWAFVVRTAEVFVVQGTVRLGVWSRVKEVFVPWERVKPRSGLFPATVSAFMMTREATVRAATEPVQKSVLGTATLSTQTSETLNFPIRRLQTFWFSGLLERTKGSTMDEEHQELLEELVKVLQKRADAEAKARSEWDKVFRDRLNEINDNVKTILEALKKNGLIK
jgi:hypothetical protein